MIWVKVEKLLADAVCQEREAGSDRYGYVGNQAMSPAMSNFALSNQAGSNAAYDTEVSAGASQRQIVTPGSVVSGSVSSAMVAPGMVLLVGRGGETIFHKAFGARSILPEVTPLEKEMVFDVASLTKVIATTTLAMKFIEKGMISLDTKVSDVMPSFGALGKQRVTVKHLLTHSSGFPAHLAFYKKIVQFDGENDGQILHTRKAVELVYRDIFRARTDNLPGKVAVYSDLGFILLGAVLEVVGAESLNKLVSKHVLQPLRMSNSGYIDLAEVKSGVLQPRLQTIVPTARCPWRDKIIVGEVHDDNAWVMGGVAGHAGLFSTAKDIHFFASEMIRCWKGRSNFIERDLIRRFWTKDSSVPGSTWTCGWDTPTPERSSAGKYFSRYSVGHLGFTGCSLWIDPERDLDVVLLSNRVHPTTENERIKAFRPAIHNAVMETLGFTASMGNL